SGLPRDLPAAVFVVVHVPTGSPSVLPTLLDRWSPLSASHARDGEAIAHARIYVAPPDYHLTVQRDRVRLTRGPRVDRSRHAIDPLFRSAALAYGPRAVGVVLTGALDDGTAGLLAIKKRRGLAVVQHPDEALYPSMPNSAIRNVEVDYILPVKEIAPLLERLAATPAEKERAYPVPEDVEIESK